MEMEVRRTATEATLKAIDVVLKDMESMLDSAVHQRPDQETVFSTKSKTLRLTRMFLRDAGVSHVPFDLACINAKQILSAQILKTALAKLWQNCHTLSFDVSVLTLKYLVKLGLHDADTFHGIVNLMDGTMNSFLWNNKQGFLWPSICKAALNPKLHPHLFTMRETWCKVLWVLADPPEGDQEPPMITAPDKQWKEFIEFLILPTTDAVARDDLCEKAAISQKHCTGNDPVSLLHAVCLAIGQNAVNAKQRKCKHEKKMTIIITDAYDRRVERLCYIATRLIQEKKVEIYPELGFHCASILLLFIKRLTKKAFIAFRYPRIAISRVRSLIALF